MLTTSPTDIQTAKEAYKKVTWFITNSSYEEFEEAFSKAHGPFVASYIEEERIQSTANPAAWLLNLDDETFEAIIEAALAKYSKR